MTDRRHLTRPRTLLAALLLALAALVLAARPARAIYDGRPADPARWGFIVALEKPGDDDFQNQFCAGSLIAPRLVLTAAHCVVDDAGRPVSARSLQVRPGGAPLRRSRTSRIDVARVVVHPRYGVVDEGWDAALLVLAADAHAPVVALPGAREAALAAPTAVLAAGWGDLTDGDKRFPTDLREGTLRLLAGTTCARVVGDLWSGPSDLCAGNWAGGQDTCHGDSGGPLVARTSGGAVLLGITSRGRGCGRARTPGIYTRVSALGAWLAPYLVRHGVPEATPPATTEPAAPAPAPAPQPQPQPLPQPEPAPPVAEPAPDAAPVAAPEPSPPAPDPAARMAWLRLIGVI